MINQNLTEESFKPGGQLYSLISNIQSWHISGGRALALLKKLIAGEPVDTQAESDMNGIFDSNEWDLKIADEIPPSWPPTLGAYTLSEVRPGDRVLLLRKKK